MKQFIEIRWHARAGQGAVTASRLVAETALDDGKYIQAMPEYGAERQGAPLRAYTRIASDPIDIHNNILHPDIVIVLDETLLPVVNVCEGIKPDGLLIVNTREDKEKIYSALKHKVPVRLYTVDASSISLESLGRDIPSAPIAGALARVSDAISLESLQKYAEKSFSEKFSPKIVQGNLLAISRAYEEVN